MVQILMLLYNSSLAEDNIVLVSTTQPASFPFLFQTVQDSSYEQICWKVTARGNPVYEGAAQRMVTRSQLQRHLLYHQPCDKGVFYSTAVSLLTVGSLDFLLNRLLVIPSIGAAMKRAFVQLQLL